MAQPQPSKAFFLMPRCQPDPWQVVGLPVFPDPELQCCHPLQGPLSVEVTLMRHSLANGAVGTPEYYDGVSLDDNGYPKNSPRSHVRASRPPPYDSIAFRTDIRAAEEAFPKFDERSSRLVFSPVASDDGVVSVPTVKFRLLVPQLSGSSLSEISEKEKHKSKKQHKSTLRSSSDSDEFCLRFRTDPFGPDGVRYEAYSAPFRVAANLDHLLPKFRARRPRHETGEEPSGGSHESSSSSSSSSSSKRARSSARFDDDDSYYYRVNIREMQKGLPEVSLGRTGSFADLRLKIQEVIPVDVMFQFWHPGMDRMINKSKEASMDVYSVVKDHDMTVEISVGIMALWDNEKSTVPVETLLQKLLQFYPMQIQVGPNSWKPCSSDQITIARLGAYDFFRFCQNKKRTKSPLPEVAFATLADFQLFLKFFGEPHRCMVKVLEAYTTKFFHRFLSSESAKEKLLASAEGSYLIRYSQSRMKDGLFALDVAKLKDDGKLTVESYLLQYDPQMEKFLFDGMYFDLFTDFVTHPKYNPHILSQPVLYTQSLVSKDPKYQDDTALVLQMERLRVHQMQQEECPPTPYNSNAALSEPMSES